MVAALVLALGAVGVLRVVPPERPDLEPVVPPAPVVEPGRAASAPSQPARRANPRPRPVIVTTRSPAPPVAAPPVAPAQEPAAVVAEPAPAPAPALADDLDSAPPVPPAEEPSQAGNGEAIARAIAAQQRAAVRTCFEHELKEQPTLTGTVLVELDLVPPTRVEAVRISDDLDRPTFTRCVTTAMQGARFATLDEEISVRVPYVLSPERK